MKKAPVRAETDYSYTNKFSGKQIRFTPKPDEIMVTFHPEPDAEVTRRAMTALPLAVSQGMNARRGFAAVRVAPGQDLPAAKGALAAVPHVANSMPVLIDNDNLTRFPIPDEFTVQFRQEVSHREAERLIAEKGCAIVTRQRTPGYYTLAYPETEGCSR